MSDTNLTHMIQKRKPVVDPRAIATPAGEFYALAAWNRCHGNGACPKKNSTPSVCQPCTIGFRAAISMTISGKDQTVMTE